MLSLILLLYSAAIYSLADGQDGAKLLIAEESSFSFLDTELFQPHLLLNFSDYNNQIPEPCHIDFHYKNKTLFYSRNSKIYIIEVDENLKPTKPSHKVVELDNMYDIYSLAVDWVHNKLYWITDNQFVRSDLDGSGKTTILKRFRHSRVYNNMAIDPHEGVAFFIRDYAICKVTLDGSRIETIVLRPGKGDFYMTLDTKKKRVIYSGCRYCLDNFEAYLSSCDYNGMNEHEYILPITLDSIAWPMSIVGSHVYFVCDKSVWTLNMANTSDIVERTTRDQYMWDMKVYHPDAQP